MKSENKKETIVEYDQNTAQSVDKSRRSFSKAGIVAPVIMTLTSKVALGDTPYHCTISGQQSGNHSGNHDWSTPCGVGFSPGAWKTPLSGQGDGSLAQWLTAGAVPYDVLLVSQQTTIQCKSKNNGKYNKTTKVQIKINNKWVDVSVDTENNVTSCSQITTSNGSKKYYIDGSGQYIQSDTVYDAINNSGLGTSATLFSSIFGGSSSDSFMEILMGGGSIDRSAIAVWLNAGNKSLFSPVYDDITQSKVVEIYQNNPTGLWDYFKLLYHPTNG